MTLRNAKKMTIREISSTVGRSVGAVHKVLNHPQRLQLSRKRGATKKINTRGRRQILRSLFAQHSSAPEVHRSLALDCSVRTVQRAIREVDWTAYKKTKAKPALTARHKQARVNWANHMMLQNDQWWRCVVFSDEKKWSMDGPNGMRFQWVDQRRQEKVNKRRHVGGGSVMVWGGFSWHGKTNLKFLVGRQDAAAYQETLTTHLLPNFDVQHQVFQHDNAPIHTARVVKNWLATQNITVMDWPALSPDLNPIENLWGILTKRVYANGRQFDKVDDLRQAIQAAWDGISIELLRKLVLSMPKRCSDVLRAQGGHTSY